MAFTYNQFSKCRRRFIKAAREGYLHDVVRLSQIFNNDVKVLSEALMEACVGSNRWYGCQSWGVGQLDVVKWLVKYTAADVNFRIGYTLLTTACVYAHLHIEKYLVEKFHVDVNLADCFGKTPLIQTCRLVNMSLSICLLNDVSNFDVNESDRTSNTALHYAVWCNKYSGCTQLHEACDTTGNLTRVMSLIYSSDYGCMINMQDNDGNTPLHRACFNYRDDIVVILMFAGADKTITNDKGETPAQVATNRGHQKLLNFLDRNSLQKMTTMERKNLNQLMALNQRRKCCMSFFYCLCPPFIKSLGRVFMAYKTNKR